MAEHDYLGQLYIESSDHLDSFSSRFKEAISFYLPLWKNVEINFTSIPPEWFEDNIYLDRAQHRIIISFNELLSPAESAKTGIPTKQDIQQYREAIIAEQQLFNDDRLNLLHQSNFLKIYS